MKLVKIPVKWAVALFITVLMSNFSLLAATTATQLAFTTQPTNTVVGAGISVVVQLKDKSGVNVSQSGVTLLLELNKGGGLSGLTNVITDANGRVAFTTLKISQAGSGDTFLATSSGLKNATSSAFNVSKASTTTALVSSTNSLVYGKNVTLTAKVTVNAPASGTPTGTVTFKDGAITLGTAALSASSIATFTTNRISATTTNHNLTAVFGGDGNFSGSTASNLVLVVGKLALTVNGAVANNRVYNGSTNATLNFSNATLATVLAGDTVTLNSASAKGFFTEKSIGNQKPVSISGLALAGASSGNYALLPPIASANITPAPLTVSGIVTSSKVYDGTTAVVLNFTNAKPVTVFSGDSVILNTTTAQGAFTSKNVGTGKVIQISGLTITGTNAGNYLLIQPATAANITPRSLTITAKGVSKIYDGTTNATVTLADNRVAGDTLTSSYTSAAFTTKNAGSNVGINVLGLTIAGGDSANYVLAATKTTTSASITKAALTVSGLVVSNKTYDAKNTATLNASNATLATIISGDSVTLNIAAAKATFASKTVGTGQSVTISGLTLAGTNAGNYTLIQPAAVASILPRTLIITAKGVNKIYDGTTNAIVTLTDNRLSGDLLTNSYASAAFTSKNVGTNILINVYGLGFTGTDAINYFLATTNITATANISPALLTVAAASVTRPYATTNPALSAVYSGFVAGEFLTNSDLAGSPALTTMATTNSSVGSYPITISKGTLVSVDYTLKFTNGNLTVIKADTAALLSTTLNPALTNQNITFAAKVNPLATTVLPPTGVIQFKCNGTNKLGNAIAVSSGAANLTVSAASLGQNNAVITAEYSDPAGNFSPSTNSLTQQIITVVIPPPPSKLSLVPSFASGKVTANLTGTAGTTYIIEASPDLVHWVSIATNVADGNGSVLLNDTNAATFPRRFYRAYSP